MREVTSYSTLGGNQKTFRTSARVWRELQTDLTSNGVSFSGMKAVIGETQVTLESAEATLPEGDFTLFLTAQKVKSGNDDYLIDEIGGIRWNEIDWSDEEEEIIGYCFKSEKDLAIARLKRSVSYLNKVVEYLDSSTKTEPSRSGKSSKLAEMAKQIEANIDLFS